jgi:hypothetical protein
VELVSVADAIMEWSYFDIEAEFKRFSDAWNSNEVQLQLEFDMQRWCQDNELDTQTWKRGDPLWNLYGGINFWDRIIGKRVNNHVDDVLGGIKKAARIFKNSMHRACGKTFEDAKYALYELLFDQFSPRSDSFESFVLFNAGDYLTASLFKTALILFPYADSTMQETAFHEMVVIPSKLLVLDILGFYAWSRTKDLDFAPENLYFPELEDTEDDVSEDSEKDDLEEVGYSTQDDMSIDDRCTCEDCTYRDDLGELGLF